MRNGNDKLLVDDYEEASKWILESQFTVIFTGAGVSVESGIPTFRGENGLWSKYNPTFLITSYFMEKPKESWELIHEIFYDFFSKAKPNEAHHVISDLEQLGLIHAIITQNIDDLHQKAGSKNVVEYHGTSRTLTCMKCAYKTDSVILKNRILPPLCPKCQGLLKPDFVFFGEPIPSRVQELSNMYALKADLFVLVGTTGEIMPASLVPFVARENGAKFIEINVEQTKYTGSIVDLFLKGKATEVFSKLKNSIETIQ